MNKQVDYIYQNKDGEYFKSIEDRGEIVLSNPSYPFVFLFEVQEPLQEIGSAKEFGHLLEKKDYQWHTGDSLTVNVSSKGNLEVVEETKQ